MFSSCLKLALTLRYVGISDFLNVNISILWVCTCATFEVAVKSGVLSWPHNFFGSYFHLPPYLGPACVFCLGRSLCWLCLGKHSDLFVTELVLLAPSLMSCHPNSNSYVMLSIEENKRNTSYPRTNCESKTPWLWIEIDEEAEKKRFLIQGSSN